MTRWFQKALEKVWVAPLVNKSNEVNCVLVNGVINVIWEWSRPPAGKAMGTNVVAAVPTNDFASLSRDAFGEGAGQPFRDGLILLFPCRQVSLEPRAEDGLHMGLPKVSSKESPFSAPDFKRSRRSVNSARICSSVPGWSSRLSIKSLAKSARSMGGKHKASSATDILLNGMPGT